MDYITESQKTLPVTDRFEVAVCGGGIAGIAAALSAARAGAKTILIRCPQKHYEQEGNA